MLVEAYCTGILLGSNDNTDYSSLPNRCDNFENFPPTTLLIQPPYLLKMSQTSHHHAYFRHHVYYNQGIK